VSIRDAKGRFVADENCLVIIDAQATKDDSLTGKLLIDRLEQLLGIHVPLVPDRKGKNTKPIRLRRLAPKDATKVLPKDIDACRRERFLAEGYRLLVSEDSIDISAVSSQGLFYGVQTLIQLLRRGRKINCCEITDYPALKMRGAFLIFAPDLRWYPGSQTPTLDYLKGVLRTLSEYKMNTLVIEYGDKFPYSKHLALNHREAFSINEIHELVEYADSCRIRIIPLLQCLGHLDYVLIHEQYAHLREGGGEGRQVCPLNPESFELFCDLAGEILDAHPQAAYLHVGGDETRELGDCPLCRKEAEKVGKGGLYLDYLNSVCAWVKQEGRTAIVWDDMLCTYPEVLDKLDRDVVIMYWDYHTGLERNPTLIARSRDCSDGVLYDQGWDSVSREELTDLQQIVLGKYGSCGVDLSSELSEEFLFLYGKYLGDEFPKYICPFPYLDFYLDKGFKVIGAPSVHGCGMGYILPNPVLGSANTSLFSRRLSQQKSEGMITTWWMSEAIPFEVCWYATIVAADSSWRPEPFSRDNFDARFCQQFFGVENSDISQAVFLLNGERIPYAQSYFPDAPRLDEQIKQFEGSPRLSAELDRLKSARDRATSALRLLQKNTDDIRHNKLAFNHLCLAAKTVAHKVTQALLFHEMEALLEGSCESVTAVLSHLQGLKQELVVLRDETEETFGMSMKPLAIREELNLRFHDEEERIGRYLDQLARQYRPVASRRTKSSPDHTMKEAR